MLLDASQPTPMGRAHFQGLMIYPPVNYCLVTAAFVVFTFCAFTSLGLLSVDILTEGIWTTRC